MFQSASRRRFALLAALLATFSTSCFQPPEETPCSNVQLHGVAVPESISAGLDFLITPDVEQLQEGEAHPWSLVLRLLGPDGEEVCKHTQAGLMVADDAEETNALTVCGVASGALLADKVPPGTYTLHAHALGACVPGPVELDFEIEDNPCLLAPGFELLDVEVQNLSLVPGAAPSPPAFEWQVEYVSVETEPQGSQGTGSFSHSLTVRQVDDPGVEFTASQAVEEGLMAGDPPTSVSVSIQSFTGFQPQPGTQYALRVEADVDDDVQCGEEVEANDVSCITFTLPPSSQEADCSLFD